MSNDPYRVLVTGSSDWKDDRLVYATMRLIFALGNHAEITWVHGDGPGLDTLVRQIVEAGQSNVFDEDKWQHEPHPIDWRDGKWIAMQRNTHMVNLDARYCLAFINPCNDARCSSTIRHGSHGTMDCAAKAEVAGIETWRFNRATA